MNHNTSRVSLRLTNSNVPGREEQKKKEGKKTTWKLICKYLSEAEPSGRGRIQKIHSAHASLPSAPGAVHDSSKDI